MKRIYTNCCIPMMLINNNIYAFISGILISLSTNIFTSLCFESFDWKQQWCLYLSTIVFMIASAACLYISYKISRFQNYLDVKRIEEKDERHGIVSDVTENDYKSWCIIYMVLILLLIIGAALLIINTF